MFGPGLLAGGARAPSPLTFCLIPGSTHDPGGWRWLARALHRSGHRVLAPRLPFEAAETTAEGCAASIASDLARLGPGQQVVMVGHSISARPTPATCTASR